MTLMNHIHEFILVDRLVDDFFNDPPLRLRLQKVAGGALWD